MQLDGATNNIIDEGLIDLPTQGISDDKANCNELHCATPNSTLFDEVDTNIKKNKKQYTIDHAMDKVTKLLCDLPLIDKTVTMPEEELPGTTTTDEHKIEDQNAENVTMLDNMPLLEPAPT